MARRDVRTEKLLAVSRVTGRRWSVAMRDVEWEKFLTEVRGDARVRLAAVMKRFCDHGDRNLPGSTFSWLTKPGEVPREAALEAGGVVLRGHASSHMLFITSVEIDHDFPAPRPRGRQRTAAALPQLSLALLTPMETSHGPDK